MFTFSMSFKHTLTSDLTWIRLTRQLDGSTVEWRFGSNTPRPTTAGR